MSTSAQAQTDDLATALRHAASLLEKDPALAEQQALEILKPFPRDGCSEDSMKRRAHCGKR
jgi:hypothetical protein